MSILLALALQVGPFVGADPRPVSPLPAEIANRPGRSFVPAAPLPPSLQPARLRDCLAKAQSDAPAAIAEAEGWLAAERGAGRMGPNRCLGAALAGQQRWAEAERAFLAGRDAAPSDARGAGATFAAMAGHAALAQGDHARALGLLDPALADATALGEKALASMIQTDRARALVALSRQPEAKAALADACAAAPDNAEAWLLSATLSRRTGDLAAAQTQIETAAQLSPGDAETGLEAGVIAAMAGRDDAARLSWQSVIDLDPKSPAAQKAQAYMEQISP